MAYPFPTEIKQLIDDRMASGRYGCEDDVLLEALRSLVEYDEAVADVQEGIRDEASGRIRPLGEAAHFARG